eukprot:CAMPEP_0203756374 /NCGR_PEP_ID=MMETSP0098-20131031/9675_1 /ASSEMBLY_ACC=CAM_ASM_000208 /TAXON_ID=96639 /ORGANISM=" , Strain NY0313808BC1" /LENGTH=1040 /DNA_ID=CAMNT_0050648241 /DNA_START=10 /DNA_END=3132 /DNA_ORIENTATION=+
MADVNGTFLTHSVVERADWAMKDVGIDIIQPTNKFKQAPWNVLDLGNVSAKLKLEVLGRKSVMLTLVLYWSTAVFAFSCVIYVFSINKEIKPKDNEPYNAYVLSVVILEGLCWTVAVCLTCFVFITFPLRTIQAAHSERRALYAEQLMIICLCVTIMIPPVFNCFGLGVFLYTAISNPDDLSSHMYRPYNFRLHSGIKNVDAVFGGLFVSMLLFFQGNMFYLQGKTFSSSEKRPRKLSEDEVLSTSEIELAEVVHDKPKGLRSRISSGVRRRTHSTVNAPERYDDGTCRLSNVSSRHTPESVHRIPEEESSDEDIGIDAEMDNYGSEPKIKSRRLLRMRGRCRFCFRIFSVVSRGMPLRYFLFLVLYFVFILVFSTVLNFSPSIIPLVGIITVIRVCWLVVPDKSLGTQSYRFCDPNLPNPLGFKRAMACTVLFLFEVFIFYMNHRLIQHTRLKLQRLPYSKYRVKHLGFLFFRTVTMIMWTFALLIAILVCSILDLEFWMTFSEPETALQNVGMSGTSNIGFTFMNLLISMWLFIMGFVFLPSDSVGCSGWFCRASPSKVDEEQRKEKFKNITMEHPVYLPRETDIRKVQQLEQDLLHNIQEGGSEEGSGYLAAKSKQVLRTISSAVGRELADYQSEICQQLQSNVLIMETEVLLLNFAHISYLVKGKIDSNEGEALIEDKRYAFVSAVFRAENDTCVFVAAAADRVIVSFRGTVSGVNVKTDMDYALVEHTLAKDIDPGSHYLHGDNPIEQKAAGKAPMVHAGFLKAYESVREELHEIVDPLIFNGNRQIRALFCTGHSLGGALAILSAFDFAYDLNNRFDQRPQVGCTTYGCPRIGCFSFKTRFEQLVPTCRRFVVAGDFIPKLPPRYFYQNISRTGYYHVGLELLLDRQCGGNMIVSPSFVERQVLHGSYSKKSHFRSRYSLAIMAFCVQCHGDDWEPDWWVSVIDNVLLNARPRLRKLQGGMLEKLNSQLNREGVKFMHRKKTVRTMGIQVEHGLEEHAAVLRFIDSLSLSADFKGRPELVDELRRHLASLGEKG